MPGACFDPLAKKKKGNVQSHPVRPSPPPERRGKKGESAAASVPRERKRKKSGVLALEKTNHLSISAVKKRNPFIIRVEPGCQSYPQKRDGT